MRIRYSRTLSITLIVLGALIAVVALGTRSWVSGVTGVLLAVLGTLQFRGPMVLIENGEAQLRNALGMVFKRFPVNSLADLRLDDKNLVHVPSGKKIAALGFGLDKDDIATLRAHLSGQQSPPQGQVPQGQFPQQGQPPHGS